MNWIDKKYINLISTQLRNFKWKSSNLANCSCPICGDSEKKKFKARFYFLEQPNHYSCYCHNCNYSAAFGHFLSKYGPQLYHDYRLEVFKEKTLKNNSEKKETIYTGPKNPVFTPEDSPLNKIPKISSCDIKLINVEKEEYIKVYEAKYYLKKRNIPESQWHRIYYTDNYRKWVNTFFPEKFKNFEEPDERIVFPFLTKDKVFYGCTGRSIYNKEPRYSAISIDFEKKYPHLYGLDSLNTDKEFYVVEGPIDSLFLDNCIAMGTSTVKLKDELPWEKATFILDNEPRNLQIIKALNGFISKGFKVCIWPENLEYKDINEMCSNGINVQKIIKENTFQDLEATVKLNMWKKINDNIS